MTVEIPIRTAGMYELPVDVYHSDPAPQVSLSSSGLRRLIFESPAHFRTHHPVISDCPVADTPTDATDLGTVIHRLVLGRGDDYAVIAGFDDWRKKAAQEARDEARANGHVPILEHTFASAVAVAAKANAGLAEEFGAWPFGLSEQTLIWQRQTSEGPVWCRALADHISPALRLIVDLKSTGRGVADHALRAMLADKGAIQAAHYLSGLDAVFPAGENGPESQFWFAVIETEPPYSLVLRKLDDADRMTTDQIIDRYAATFARCLQSDSWPGPARRKTLPLPSYRSTEWSDLLVNDFEASLGAEA